MFFFFDKTNAEEDRKIKNTALFISNECTDFCCYVLKILFLLHVQWNFFTVYIDTTIFVSKGVAMKMNLLL